MSSLLTKPTVQHHHSRVSPVQLRDFPLNLTWRAGASSIERSLTRTPAPVMIFAGSKCWTPSRWIVISSCTSANVLGGYDLALSRTTRFTDAWVAGIDAIVRGEGNRAIGASAPDDLDIAGGACTTRCLQRGEQRTKASSEPLLFRIQYRMARVALSEPLLRSLLISIRCFF